MYPETTQQTPQQASQGRRRSKRNAAIGVTAGVLGGGAIGLLMTVPSLTSAASDDAMSVAEPAAVVALQDDTGSDTGDDSTVDDTTTDSARPEPGVRLRESLQALVDDGTLTAEQADAVTTHLVENRPERGDRGDRGGEGRRGNHPGADGEVVAGLLGIDAETLRTELRAGSSIADIATANGVDVQVVVDALVEEAQGHLDLAVENGRLTDEEAGEKLTDLTERITARVNGERPTRG